jgi:hypothetical protein
MERHRPLRGEHVREVPVHDLHHGVGDPRLLSDGLKRYDVRVDDLGGGLHLLPEPPRDAGLVNEVEAEDLQCDPLTRRGIRRLIDHGHRTSAEYPIDSVLPED